MLRINEDGSVESIYPIEDLCEHCKKENTICFYGSDMGGYPKILSLNPKENYDYIIDCPGFDSHDGIYKVMVEVEENPSLADRIDIARLAYELHFGKEGT